MKFELKKFHSNERITIYSLKRSRINKFLIRRNKKGSPLLKPPLPYCFKIKQLPNNESQKGPKSLNKWKRFQAEVQHFGRSVGGGSSFWFGCFPSKTTQAILRPQLVWTSKWQCMNHTPAKHSSANSTKTFFN